MLKPFHPTHPGQEPNPAFYDTDGSNLLDMDPGRFDDDLHPCFGFKVTTTDLGSPSPWRWEAKCGGCRVTRHGWSEQAALAKIRRHQDGFS